MKRAFSLLFIILSLLTFKNVAFAQPEVDGVLIIIKRDTTKGL
jgi:hypothetical protein